MVLIYPNKSVTIKLIIEYNGSRYFGWQRQKNKPTIQQTIEESLEVLLHEPISLTGAGRTDAGVHALGQVAQFTIDKDLYSKIEINKLAYRLNCILPADITVREAAKARGRFHARYSAKKRFYRYRFSCEKQSYEADKIFHYKGHFDEQTARDFCKLIEGRHSYKGLCKNDTDEHDFESVVYFARIWQNRSSVYEFEICANRFLHSMVRAIVGAMLTVSSCKMSLNVFEEKFKKGERMRVQYVPAYALLLEKIIY